MLLAVQFWHRSASRRQSKMPSNVIKHALLPLALLAAALPTPWAADGPVKSKPAEKGVPILWSDPADIASRNLYYGPGGKEHEPHPPFTFVKEDLEGTNPKFVVKDRDGVKWKVKLGLEARSETAATRLVWAAGFFATEDYYLRDLPVSGMPVKLHRGWKFVDPDGTVHNVRLKREPEGRKKIGIWSWDDSPFTGTRECNGLRTLMAVINNWDLKDVNNAIYRRGPEEIYMVSDLGASFGTPGRSWPRERAKDNLDEFSRAKFVRRLTRDSVDFQAPARPQWEYAVNPKEYFSRFRLEHIGKNIPRADAKWLGDIMSRLSIEQIRDAFRASGYSPDEVEGFSKLIEDRIVVLTDM
jgi:hypothetical protein